MFIKPTSGTLLRIFCLTLTTLVASSCSNEDTPTAMDGFQQTTTFEYNTTKVILKDSQNLSQLPQYLFNGQQGQYKSENNQKKFQWSFKELSDSKGLLTITTTSKQDSINNVHHFTLIPTGEIIKERSEKISLDDKTLLQISSR